MSGVLDFETVLTNTSSGHRYALPLKCALDLQTKKSKENHPANGRRKDRRTISFLFFGESLELEMFCLKVVD